MPFKICHPKSQCNTYSKGRAYALTSGSNFGHPFISSLKIPTTMIKIKSHVGCTMNMKGDKNDCDRNFQT